jgi:hypothetical protein
MNIEFNTSRIPKPVSGEPVTKRDTTPTVADGASFPAATSLEARLNEIPAARPEKVELAKALISNSQYPPEDLLARIAVLLAIHSGQ